MLQDRKSRLAEERRMMSQAAVASRVGTDLSAARERLGWELKDIAAHLRIRLPYLEAIEQGRVKDLPGNAYAVGFVRTYAQALGLDPDEVGRRFRAEVADLNRKTELDFPAPVPERGVPAGALVLLGVVLAVGAYAGWYRLSGNRGPSVERVEAVPERLAKLAEPDAPAQTAQSPAPQAVAAAIPADEPAPYSPTSAAAASIPMHVASPPVATPPPLPDGARILLRARADAWVQVRDRGGAIVLNRVMRKDESWVVPAKGDFALTTGNAGGTDLVVDGVSTPSLGPDGAVRRDIALNADQLRAVKTP